MSVNYETPRMLVVYRAMPPYPWLTLTILVAISFINPTDTARTPCPKQLTIDITKGRKLRNDVIYHTGIYFPTDKYFSEQINGTVKTFGCICEFKKCYRKCCPLDQAFGNSGKCEVVNSTVSGNFKVPVFNVTEPIEVEERYFHVLVNKFCPQAAYTLNPAEFESDSHFLQPDGSLYQNYSGISHPPENYCFEFFEPENSILPLVCFMDMPETDQDELYSTGKII